LVVDDDREIVLGTRLRLRFAGYDSVAAFDGREGISAALEQYPDVTILDIRMPRMDGLAMIRELKSRPETRNVPVVVLSASLRDKRRALEAGARFVLTKPCRSADLLEAVLVAIQEPLPVAYDVDQCAPSNSATFRGSPNGQDAIPLRANRCCGSSGVRVTPKLR
jgi:CheY-like chemotaxis protein